MGENLGNKLRSVLCVHITDKLPSVLCVHITDKLRSVLCVHITDKLPSVLCVHITDKLRSVCVSTSQTFIVIFIKLRICVNGGVLLCIHNNFILLITLSNV